MCSLCCTQERASVAPLSMPFLYLIRYWCPNNFVNAFCCHGVVNPIDVRERIKLSWSVSMMNSSCCKYQRHRSTAMMTARYSFSYVNSPLNFGLKLLLIMQSGVPLLQDDANTHVACICFDDERFGEIGQV